MHPPRRPTLSLNCFRTFLPQRLVGVAVSTTDSDSVDGGSIPSRAFLEAKPLVAVFIVWHANLISAILHFCCSKSQVPGQQLVYLQISWVTAAISRTLLVFAEGWDDR